MVKLFVGNLNPESKAADLRRKFEAYGKVTECDIVNNFGFVHMEKDSDAEAAMAGLQNTILDGVKINVERSHGKRGGGPGPIRRRPEGRFRDYPPDRFRGPPPPRYMGGPPAPPPPRMGRYGPGWDDGYGGPYGPPPPRASPRGGYDYPANGTSGRYPPPPDRSEPVRPPPRGPGREPLPPPPAPGPGYRGPSMPEPLPPREYPSKPAPPPPRPRYDTYDGYGDYDRYREPAPPVNSRQNDYYDNYGSYSSGGSGAGAGYDDYRESERLPPSSYESGYDYGYYDYGTDSRSPAPPRYSYGRP